MSRARPSRRGNRGVTPQFRAARARPCAAGNAHNPLKAQAVHGLLYTADALYRRRQGLRAAAGPEVPPGTRLRRNHVRAREGVRPPAGAHGLPSRRKAWYAPVQADHGRRELRALRPRQGRQSLCVQALVYRQGACPPVGYLRPARCHLEGMPLLAEHIPAHARTHPPQEDWAVVKKITQEGLAPLLWRF